MRTVGLKLESSVFTATMAKIIRKYQELPISQIKQIVSNNDYVYKCDIIRANGIKTLLHVKKDLSKEGINSYIYVEGKLTSEEYLNNLLVSSWGRNGQRSIIRRWWVNLVLFMNLSFIIERKSVELSHL